MGPDETLSPALLKKVIHAASSASFEQASEDLLALAEVKVSANRIHRAALRVGNERVADRRAAAIAYRQLPLPQQRLSPGPAPPAVACVQADGGRIQLRPRGRQSSEADSWWRETKVGCLLAMTSDRHREDPVPVIPETFLDLARMAQLAREIQGFSRDETDDAAPPGAPEPPPREAPQVVAHTVVATTEKVEAFGELLVARAHELGFAAAQRKAFVADGSETNWGLWRRCFSHYTPILDWVHALCYVYAAAMAGVTEAEGREDYGRWAQWLWSGDVDRLLAALGERQARLGPPTKDDSETSPSQRVADALRYVGNQRARMNYPAYRREGLPITSSHVESTIKRINRRMKGTEKFWDAGAEPLLQLVADRLSPSADSDRYWNKRPRRLSPQRCYQQAA